MPSLKQFIMEQSSLTFDQLKDQLWQEYVKYSETNKTALKDGQNAIEKLNQGNGTRGDPYEIAETAADNVEEELRGIIMQSNECKWMSDKVKKAIAGLSEDEQDQLISDMHDVVVDGLI